MEKFHTCSDKILSPSIDLLPAIVDYNIKHYLHRTEKKNTHPPCSLGETKQNKTLKKKTNRAFASK